MQLFVADSCSPNPCQNGGTCSRTAAAAGGYKCACQAGYSGTNCESKYNC